MCLAVDELYAKIHALAHDRPQGKGGTCATVFILLPDASSWHTALDMLRREDMTEFRLSKLCTPTGQFPAPSRIIKLINRQSGRILLAAAGELLRAGAYPARALLFERLSNMRHRGGAVFVPLMACSKDFRAAMPENFKATILEAVGPEKPCPALFCSSGLPVAAPLDLTGWLSAFEAGSPPENAHVCTAAPLRFAGRGVRAATSCYELLASEFYGLEFIAEAEALSEANWRRLYKALRGIAGGAARSAREVFERCADMESGHMLSPDDPLRLGAWLYRLAGLHAGAYAKRILDIYATYDSIEAAVTLELLAGFSDSRAGIAGALAPEQVGTEAWLDIRAERGNMLRALGISEMPPAYWHMLEKVPARCKLLYSSLCTGDERGFCRKYLCDNYNMSLQQLSMRHDIKRMFPELLAEAEQARQKGTALF